MFSSVMNESKTVKHGHIYRPIFLAEEQLVQAAHQTMAKRSPKRLNSVRPCGDSLVHRRIDCAGESDDHEKEETDMVANLPDQLPDKVHHRSERIERMIQRKRDRHQTIVNAFYGKMKHEMSFYNSKIEDLINALKSTLSVNHDDISQAVNSLDDNETLAVLSSSDFEDMWRLCKEMNASNLESIEKFKEAYFNLQQMQTNKVTVILRETLDELLQNAYLPKEENHRLIDSESMLLNEANMTNSRCLSRHVLSLIERETQTAIQCRINFSQRKSTWIRCRVDNRIENFVEILDSNDVLSPPKVKNTLDNLCVEQGDLIRRRKELLMNLTTYNPSQPQFTFDEWAKEMEEIHTQFDLGVKDALTTIKEDFISLANHLMEEQHKLRRDLEEIVDPDELDTLMEPLITQAESLIKAHYVDYRQLNLNFRTLSTRNMSQVAISGRIFSELAQCWMEHETLVKMRKEELEDALNKTREVFAQTNHCHKVHLKSKIKELRQTEDGDKIDRKEHFLRELIKVNWNQLKQERTRQENIHQVYRDVISRETETYQINLGFVFDVRDREIEKIKPYDQRYMESIKNLSEASKVANDKWCWIMNKKAIEKDIEENDQKEFLEKYRKTRMESTRQTMVTSPAKSVMSNSTSISPVKSPSPRKTGNRPLWKAAAEKGFSIAKAMRQRANDMIPKMSSEQGFYWDNDGVLKKVLKRNTIQGKKKVRLVIPPISWFYESGGLSPRRKKNNDKPKPRTSIFQVYNLANADKNAEIDETCAESDSDAETIDIECETDNLFNVFEDLGENAPEHQLCIDAFKISFMKEAELAEQRNLMRRQFRTHSRQSASGLKNESKENYKQWRLDFDGDAREKEQDDNKHVIQIHEEVVDVRRKELKRHAKKWTRHESNTKLKMKDLLVHIQDAKAQDEVIIEKLKLIEKSTSTTLAKLSAAQKVFDLERIRDESFGECDTIGEELQANHQLAAEVNTSTVKALKVAQAELLKTCVLFKDGGNYSKAELSIYKARAAKLEVKLSRFEFIQNNELEKTLPEKWEQVEEAKRKWLVIYDDHLRDVTMLVNLAEIKRKSHVFTSCELSRMQKNVSDCEVELKEMESSFKLYWSNSDQSASALHERLQIFRKRLREVVNSIKHPDAMQFQLKSSISMEGASSILPDDFYIKWLVDGEQSNREEKPLLGSRRLSSVRLNKRQSVLNATNQSAKRQTGQLTPSVPKGRLTLFDPNYVDKTSKSVVTKQQNVDTFDALDTIQQNIGQQQKLAEKVKIVQSVQQVIRRKLLDLKSEVKQQIFGFHQKPKPVDFPTVVTGLIFERVTKLVDAYEEYYKTKGSHSITRPELISDTFEKSCEKVKSESVEYEAKAVMKTNAAYKLLIQVLERAEILHSHLPKILFHDFYRSTTQSISGALLEIRTKRQILMNAYEEAKEEHFDSIRINVGHPSYEGQLTELNNKESTRRKKHTWATKDRAKTLLSMLNDMIKTAGENMGSSVQLYFDEFDKICQAHDVLNGNSSLESDKNSGLVSTTGQFSVVVTPSTALRNWGVLNLTGLPNFQTEQFTSKKETVAHSELNIEKEKTLQMLKTFYAEQTKQVETEEQVQLAEIQRWVNYWKLQISEVKACFED